MTSSARRITVRHRDENYGPYAVADVNQLLVNGRLDRDDLAWIEGSPDWVPLRDIDGVLAVPPAPDSHRDQYGDDVSDRLILPAFLLAFFVGAFGVHRFYVGKTGSGIAMLLLTISIVGIFVSAIWALVDWIVILMGNFTDDQDRQLKRWT